MAFKMKGSPMQRNFPSAFPKEGTWAKIKETAKDKKKTLTKKVKDFKGSKGFKDFKYNIGRIGEEIRDTFDPNKESLSQQADRWMR